MADGARNELRLRDLATATEGTMANLPFTIGTDIGGLAAQQMEDGSVRVYFLHGGSDTAGFFGGPLGYNELYVLTLRPSETPNPDGSFSYFADGSFTLLADFLDEIEGLPVQGAVPFRGLGLLGNDFYTMYYPLLSDNAGKSGGEYSPDRIGELLSLNIQQQTFQATMRFPRLFKPTTLEGVNSRGTIFLAGPEAFASVYDYHYAGSGKTAPMTPWRDAFAYGTDFWGFNIFEYDPRTKYVAQVLFRPKLDDAPLFFSDIGAEGVQYDGMGWNDGVLVLTGRGYFWGEGAPEGFARFFITLDPNERDANGHPIVLSLDFDNDELQRAVFGLAGVSGTQIAPSVPLSNPAGGIDTTSIDALFATLAYSPQAVNGMTPLSAMYALHFLDTSLDPGAAFYTDTFDAIPGALADNANKTSGIGRATHDLRSELPPGHPASSITGPGLDVIFSHLTYSQADSGGSFANLSERDLRRFDSMQLLQPSLVYNFDFPVDRGGITTQQNGQVVRLLRGGDAFQGGEAGTTFAYNEVYEIDLSARNPQWRLIGKFADAAIGNPEINGRLLTDIATFASSDYATTLDSDLVRLIYDTSGSGGSYHGQIETVARLGWDRLDAIAAAPGRGEVYLIGSFQGVDFNQTSGHLNPMATTSIYAFDPRNTFIKNSWWGFAGDFNTTAATTAGTFYTTNAPNQLLDIRGSAFVDGSLVIAGTLDFGGSGGRFFESGAIVINVDAKGTPGDPHLMRFDSLEAANLLGLASRNDGASAASPIQLAEAMDGTNTVIVDPDFAKLSYSNKALRSGLITQVFAAEFARGLTENNQNAYQCRLELLSSGKAHEALMRYAGQKDGIGQATAYLLAILDGQTPTCGSGVPR